MRKVASRAGVSIAVAIVVVLVAAEFRGSAPLRFRHAPHLEEGASCADCHDVAADERGVALLRSACEDCHDDGTPDARLARISRPLVLAFRHRLHAEALDCVDCHRNVASDAAVPGAPVLRVAQCFGCHEENEIETPERACQTCHGEDARRTRPAGHDASWVGVHGRRAKAGLPAAHGRRCGQCHDEQTCMACHQSRKPMSHRRHLEEREAECGQCHPSSSGAEAPGVAEEACADCHGGEVRTSTIRGPARALEASFPHGTHAEALECAECHLRTVKDEHPSGEPMVAQPRCVACHDENEVGVAEADCGRCHAGDRRRTAPQSHRVAWRLRHGEAAGWCEVAPHGQDCFQCHARSSCDACHATARPRSHTGLWRSRLHGRAAEWSRESCRTCHETGACVGCHRRTAPTSHRGAFRATHGLMAASRADARCAVCHEPSWCTACHLGR